MPTLFDATCATQRPSSTSPCNDSCRRFSSAWRARSSGDSSGARVGVGVAVVREGLLDAVDLDAVDFDARDAAVVVAAAAVVPPSLCRFIAHAAPPPPTA